MIKFSRIQSWICLQAVYIFQIAKYRTFFLINIRHFKQREQKLISFKAAVAMHITLSFFFYSLHGFIFTAYALIKPVLLRQHS